MGVSIVYNLESGEKVRPLKRTWRAFDSSGRGGRHDIELHLRLLVGEAGYAGGVIDHDVTPLIYPPGLSCGLQVFMGGVVLNVNIFLYWQGHTGEMAGKGNETALQPAPPFLAARFNRRTTKPAPHPSGITGSPGSLR